MSGKGKQTAHDYTFFDADEYSREENGADGINDDAKSTGSWTSVTTTSSMDEARPRYVPPHKRPIDIDMGETTQVTVGPKPDEQGVQNRAFQRIMIYVHFALTKALIEVLAKKFPGFFFHSKSHGNHDHPIAHVVTQVGTRLLQRMIRPGAKILDVFGNPNACDSFNASQRKASNPKEMKALVCKACPSDFIREVNKWGQYETDEEGVRYYYGGIKSLDTDTLSYFNVYQMIHTLYYVSNDNIMKLLNGSWKNNPNFTAGKRKVLALIHTHKGQHGYLNAGEQEYWVKGGIVKQRNIKTNTTYCHPNITPFWFRENKVWWDQSGDQGFTWETHYVCEDTWIVEIVGAIKEELFDDEFANNWEETFDACEKLEALHLNHRDAPEVIQALPSRDGKFVELNVVCPELYSQLRRRAAGKDRNGKAGRLLLQDLFMTAKNLVHPGALFPDQAALPCDDRYLADHVIAAFVADVDRETNLYAAVDMLKPILEEHARKVTGKQVQPGFKLGSLVDLLRASVKTGISVNRIVRSKDPIHESLGFVDRFLDDGFAQ